MNFKEHLGDRIRSLRTDKGLTQDELSDRIGKRKNHVSHYESGRNAPQAETLARIAAALGTSTDFLLTGAEPSESNRARAALYEGKFDDTENGDLYPVFVPSNGNSVPSEPNLSASSNFLVPVRAQAGLGGQYMPDDLRHKLERVVIPGIKGPAYTFEVEGDSMEPVLFEGDYVVCHQVDDYTKLHSKAIYLVITRSSGVYVKLFKALSPSSYVFYSANASYNDTRLDHDDVAQIWEGVARISYHVRADGMPSDELRRIDAMADFLKQKFPDFSGG